MGDSDPAGMVATSLLRLSPIGVSSLFTPLSSQGDKSLQFKLRSQAWLCVSSGIQAWKTACSPVSFFALESSLILLLVGFIVECWSCQNHLPQAPSIQCGRNVNISWIIKMINGLFLFCLPGHLVESGNSKGLWKIGREARHREGTTFSMGWSSILSLARALQLRVLIQTALRPGLLNCIEHSIELGLAGPCWALLALWSLVCQFFGQSLTISV